MGRCPTDTDQALVLTDSDEPSDFADCTFPLGFTFRLFYGVSAMPENEDPPPTDIRSEGHEPHHTPADSERLLPEQEAASTTTESVASNPPSTDGVAELSQLKDLAGGNSLLMVGMALIAVLGGGAAWKFYQKHSEQKHEQAMRRLDLEAKSLRVSTTSPPPCVQVHAKLESQIADLSERISKTEKKSLAFTASGVDLEELESRVHKLERAKKSPSARKP